MLEESVRMNCLIQGLLIAFGTIAEIEEVIQGDLDDMAAALSSIWQVLADLDGSPPPEETRIRLEGVIDGIEQLINKIANCRTKVAALGWQRRRDYEAWLDVLERLGQFRDIKDFDVYSALYTAMEASDYFRMLRPETGKYFKGLGNAVRKFGCSAYHDSRLIIG